MITKKRLQKYLGNQLDTMRDDLQKLHDKLSKKTLHHLRVNAKKVQATAQLVSEISGHKKRYSIKAVKPLFKSAGRIRTAQLVLQTLNKNHIRNQDLAKNQQQIIEEESKNFFERHQHFKKQIALLKKKLKKEARKIGDNDVLSFYYTNINTLNQLFENMNVAHLHDGRKVLKKLMYNTKLLPKKVAGLLALNIHYIDEMQDLIGRWHDANVTLSLLAKMSTVDNKGFAAITEQKMKLLQRIVHEIENFSHRLHAPTTA